jgi:hypothetical protein
MNLVESEAWNDCAGEHQQQLNRLKLVAETEDSLGNPEEGGRPPLEVAIKQRLVKTQRTSYVL